jgi:predicted nucleotide-binding protein
MPYHAKIHWGGSESSYLFNLTAEEVEHRIVRPWLAGSAIVARGRQYNVGYWMASIYEYGSVAKSGENFGRWYRVETNGHDITDNFISEPYGSKGGGKPSRPKGDTTKSTDVAVPPEAQEAVDPRNVMVIHGRDLTLRDDMFNLLRALGLAPLEWAQLVSLVREGSPYIGRVLERAFEVAQAAVVLFSPDDEVRLVERLRADGDPEDWEAQARPNVFFEAGLAFGRFPEKSVLVELGDLRTASDLAGRHVLRFDGSAERRHELAERLAVAGCPVDRSGTDWLRVGEFSASGP